MRKPLKTLALASLMALSACEGAAAPDVADGRPANPNAPQLALSVESVSLAMTRKMPPSLIIRVKGTVRTAGWTDAALMPLQTFAPEGDMRSFTLVAKPPAPDMFVAQVITPIEATVVLDPLPQGVKRIRILSETNEASAEINP